MRVGEQFEVVDRAYGVHHAGGRDEIRSCGRVPVLVFQCVHEEASARHGIDPVEPRHERGVQRARTVG